VKPGSIAEECGILPGDLLVEINGRQLKDVIDYRFWSADPDLELVFVRGDEEHQVQVEKDWNQELGIEFDSPLFDRIKTCRNNCGFCFLKNLPRGLRPSLYIKDDDYRLSFLFGNFVTLSNLEETDLDRISHQRLSPLYVSVHATERRLRNQLLGIEAPDILEQIDELGRRGIEIHAQVVLCPGINDGAHLERTIQELAVRSDVVASMAVVPVGLTRFTRDPALRCYRPDEAVSIIEQLRPIQRSFRARVGRTFVHLADEFYTLSGVRVPPAAWYDGFPQLDNGVGLVRRLLSGWANLKRQLPKELHRPRRIGWICGTSARSVLQHLAGGLSQVDGLHVEVCSVVNEFFGAMVTVSGLLAGSDVVAELKGKRMDGWVLPRVMFDASGERTLDGMTLEQIRRETADPIWIAQSPGELLQVSLFGSWSCAE